MTSSKVTIEFGELLDSGFDIGLLKYPIYDEKHRAELNMKIFERYRFKQIGQETPARFKFMLNRHMNEIMPKYNEYYETKTIVFNPLYNIEMIEDSIHTVDNQSGSTSGNNSKSSSFSQDTPNIKLTIDQINGDSGGFLSDTSAGEDVTTGSIVATGKTTDTYHNTTVGSSAGLSFSHAIEQWRAIIINIDEQILDNLSENFYSLLN